MFSIVINSSEAKYKIFIILSKKGVEGGNIGVELQKN
jgi:hypothetical protein